MYASDPRTPCSAARILQDQLPFLVSMQQVNLVDSTQTRVLKGLGLGLRLRLYLPNEGSLAGG